MFGGPVFTGGAGGAINSLQSWGPSVSVFNPEDVGVKSPVPATLVLGYPYGTPLANTSIGNNYWSETDVVSGVVFIPGTRSVLFFGEHGLGNYCYGTGAECNDPANSSKGTHAYPYKSWVWAYDANDLLTVKSGQKLPSDIKPYAVWNLDSSFTTIQGVAYDPATQRLYISQVWADGERPMIRVYKVNAGTATTPTPTPTPSFSSCDLNKDNQVNILDLQFLANVILGISSCPTPSACDLNKDGQTNILDLQFLANVILGKSVCM